MPVLSVRKLDKYVYERLRVQAAEHGVSMEEEARQIITKGVVETPHRISDVFQKYFGSKNGVDLDLSDHQKSHKPIDFKK